MLKTFLIVVYFLGGVHKPVYLADSTKSGVMEKYEWWNQKGGHYKLYEIDLSCGTVTYLEGCR